jgi:peptidase YpeB-like protein
MIGNGNRVRRVTNERINAALVKVPMRLSKASIITLALAVSWIRSPCAEQSEAELLKQARVTKDQAERIALARVRHGTIKSAELEKENGVLIWSFDIAQPGKRNITEVWVDATTGKVTALTVETPKGQAREAAGDKTKK